MGGSDAEKKRSDLKLCKMKAYRMHRKVFEKETQYLCRSLYYFDPEKKREKTYMACSKHLEKVKVEFFKYWLKFPNITLKMCS